MAGNHPLMAWITSLLLAASAVTFLIWATKRKAVLLVCSVLDFVLAVLIPRLW
jgi:hypothetical protein